MPQAFLRFWDFENKLRADQLPRHLSFFGEEAFLSKRALTLLRRKLFGGGDDFFTYSVCYAEETDLSGFLDQARTLPMMSPQKLMVLKNTNRVPTADLPKLAAYFQHPALKTQLVFEFDPEYNPWSRKTRESAMLKLMDAHTLKFQFQRLEEAGLVRFLEKYAADEGLRIDRPALGHLAQRLGGDLGIIVNELEKLRLLADPAAPITRDNIDRLMVKHPSATISDMVNAMAERDTSRALARLGVLLEEGEYPLMIVGSILRFLRQAIMYKSLTEKGLSDDEIILRLRKMELEVFSRNLGDLKAAHRHYRPEELTCALAAIGQVDEQFKSMHIDAQHRLEIFLIDLCRSSRG